MALFFNAEEKVRKLIFEYMFVVDQCLEAFHDEISHCLEDGESPVIPESQNTHALESKADDLATAISHMLFGQSLLPEAKYDIVTLLDAIDKIPNAAERTLAMMRTMRIHVPEKFKPAFRDLVERNMDAYRYLRKTVDALFNTPKHTLEMAQEVDTRESAADKLELRMIKDIFDYETMEKADKIILRDLIQTICCISDRSENAADALGLIAIKRKI